MNDPEDRTRKQIREQKAEIERLTARLIAESGEVEDLVNRLQESEDDNGRLMKRIAKLEADSKGWESDWTKAMHRVEGLQARIDELESVRDAARVFMYQHDNGDDATAELELLDQALANSEAET